MALASSAGTYSSPSGPKCAQCGRTSLPRSMTATVLARQVDDLNRTTVRARLSHPCVSVDGNVAEATVRGDSNLVLVQPELERRRSPLVSIPPCGRGFSRHRGLSIR